MRRYNTHLILLFMLTATAGLLLYSSYTTYYQNLLNEARLRFNAVSAQSKVLLVGVTQELLRDSTLTDNLQWGLNHSVEKTLEAGLRHGELDQLAVFAADCTLIAKAGINKISLPCPDQTHKGTALNWLQDDEDVFLTVKIPLEADRAVRWFLVGAVKGDRTMLLRDPLLKQLSSELNLDVGLFAKVHRGTELMLESGTGEHAFGLYSTSYWMRLFSNVSAAGNDRVRALIWLLLTMSMICAVHMWREQSSKKTLGTARETEFFNWLFSYTGAGTLTPEQVADHSLNNAKAIIERFAEEKHATQASQKEKLFQITSELRHKDVQVRQAQARLLEYVNLDSLALQLNRCVKTLKSDLQTLQSLSEDIIDTLVHGLARNVNTASAIMRQWQNEINLKGVRRFVRALSETTTESGESLLEDQLRTLMTISNQMEGQLLHATSFTQRVIKLSKDADRLGSHWHDLTHEPDLAPRPASFLDVSLAAQQLLSERDRSRLRFSNQFELAGISATDIGLSKPVWISLLYHIYSALAEEVFINSAGELTTSLRILNKQQSLVIASPVTTAIEDSVYSQSHHFKVAEKLARRYGFSIDGLPGVTGLVGFCVGWPQEGLKTQLIPQSKERPRSTELML